MIQIEIETANEAFGKSPSCEVARILRDLATRFERDIPLTDRAPFGSSGVLHDVNLNRVGFWCERAGSLTLNVGDSNPRPLRSAPRA